MMCTTVYHFFNNSPYWCENCKDQLLEFWEKCCLFLVWSKIRAAQQSQIAFVVFFCSKYVPNVVHAFGMDAVSGLALQGLSWTIVSIQAYFLCNKYMFPFQMYKSTNSTGTYAALNQRCRLLNWVELSDLEDAQSFIWLSFGNKAK